MKLTSQRWRRPVAAVLSAVLLATVTTALTSSAASSSAAAPTLAPASADRDDAEEADDARPRITDIVVKLDPATGYTAADVARDFPVALRDDVLASRLIYLFRPTDRATRHDEDALEELADDMEKNRGVIFAEPDIRTLLADDHYHSWPAGTAKKVGPKIKKFRRQPIARHFRLRKVQQLSTGRGVTVAVLDTGVARRHPVLRGHLRRGYDFVDDDRWPIDRAADIDRNANGVVDEAYGHGTFVAGMVALVAPDARIMSMRVLDSDGTGSIYLVAQAIWEATDLGADIINLSLGTDGRITSDLLDLAIEHAHDHGVEVVAAAGNSAKDSKTYPADHKHVVGVTSVSVRGGQVSKFANWGDWVDVAAPASRVRGPVPGGGFARWAGTSMAAPQVSGQLALLIAAGAEKKDRESAMRETAREFAEDAPKEIKYGTVDILASLRYYRSHR